MSYYTIDGIPVFITWSKFFQLREEVMYKLDIEDDPLFGLAAWRPKDVSLLNTKTYELLKKKKSENEQLFYSYWVPFNMDKAEAIENVWDLLYDYSHLTGNAIVRDIGDNHMGNSYLHPMGKLFALEFISPANSLLKYLFGYKRCTGRIIIDVENVTKVQGRLDDFILIYRDNPIRFATYIELY